MVGNSSSGLIEAPSFRIPTLDIGDRQKGRASGRSVVSVGADRLSISEGLLKVLSPEFRESLAGDSSLNPYEKPGTLDAIFSRLVSSPLSAQKSFHDITA